MRVCLVNSFYPPYIGGAETYASNLAKNLAGMGHSVTVYCGDRPLSPGVSHDGEVEVVRMRTPLTFYGTPLTRFPARFVAEDFDIIHCNFPNPYFATVSGMVAKARGVPAVLTWHNDLPRVTVAASALVRLNAVASAAYLKPYSRIVATTKVYARESEVLRRQPGKVEVISNGVDTSRFNPGVSAESVRERHKLNGFKTLVFVGALTTWHTYKGLEELLRAFAISEKTGVKLKLVVVGGGNLLGYYRSVARRLGCSESVVFAGRVDDEDLPGYYAASDYAALPSRDASEGFGLTLLEAMACGKPVIGSRVGGIPDIVEEGRNGLLVEPRNPEALARAIQRLYADDDLRERLGKAGSEFAQSRSWRVVAEKVDAVYREISR